MALGNPGGSGATREQIYVIGDSIGVQLLPHLQKLAAKSGVLMRGSPVGGWRVSTWMGNAKGIETVAAAKLWPATTFVVVLGTNDVLAGQVPDIKPLCDRLKQGGAKVVWVGPGKLPGASSNQIVTAIRAQALTLSKVAYVDTRGANVPLQSDKIHPTTAGAAQLAGLIWTRIKPELLLASEGGSGSALKVAAFVGGAVGFFVAGRWFVDRVTRRRTSRT